MSADDVKLPSGMGPYEDVVKAALVLRAVRRGIAEGEDFSEKEARLAERALEEAARRLVSSESAPPPPDAEWLEKHGESERARAQKLAEEIDRKRRRS